MCTLARLLSSVSIVALLSPAAYANTLKSDPAHPNLRPSAEAVAHSSTALDKNRQRRFNVILKPGAAGIAGASSAIESYFQRFGFQTQYHAYTNSIELHGTYAQAERAGGYTYVTGGPRSPYRLSSQPQFPNEIAGAILAHTFDPGPVMEPQLTTLSPIAPSTLPTHAGVIGLGPPDYGTIYGYKNAYNSGWHGGGQTVDIAACYGYSAAAITLYQNDFGLSPAPNITAFYPSGNPHTYSAEPLLDLSRVYGTAPAAAIRIWFSPNCTFSEFTNLFLDIANDQSAHPAVALTVSYGLPELYLYQLYGSGLFTGMDAALASITGGASQKVALFAASGDNGDDTIFDEVYAGYPFGTSDVLYPASDPNVLAVGGTTVFPVSPTNVTRQAEWAWSGAALSNITGSGGGISNIWAIPPWQVCTGAVSLPNGAPLVHGACGPQASTTHKNVPDIASVASLESDVLLPTASGLIQSGGTSAASPTLAGTVALLQQYFKASGHPVTNWPVFFYSNYGQWLTPITGGGNGRYVAQPATSTNPMAYSNVTGLGVPCLLHFPSPCTNGQ